MSDYLNIVFLIFSILVILWPCAFLVYTLVINIASRKQYIRIIKISTLENKPLYYCIPGGVFGSVAIHFDPDTRDSVNIIFYFQKDTLLHKIILKRDLGKLIKVFSRAMRHKRKKIGFSFDDANFLVENNVTRIIIYNKNRQSSICLDKYNVKKLIVALKYIKNH